MNKYIEYEADEEVYLENLNEESKKKKNNDADFGQIDSSTNY